MTGPGSKDATAFKNTKCWIEPEIDKLLFNPGVTLLTPNFPA
jgi:hypothetical protein